MSGHSSVLLTSIINCCVPVYEDYLDSMASYKQPVIICACVYFLILHSFIHRVIITDPEIRTKWWTEIKD